MPLKEILVELDALLDTRVGTIALMDPELVPKLLRSKFRERDRDKFSVYLPGFDDDLFEKTYRERNLSTLNNSMMTDVSVAILDIMDQEIERMNSGDRAAANPLKGEFQIVVNHYPYPLTETHIEEYRKVVATTLGLMYKDVTFSWIPPKEMTAGWLKSRRWAVIIHYNYADWVTAAFNVKEPGSGSPETTTIVPGLLNRHADLSKIKNLNNVDIPTKDPYEIQKIAFAGIMGLAFLKPVTFSHIDLTEMEKYHVNMARRARERH